MSRIKKIHTFASVHTTRLCRRVITIKPTDTMMRLISIMLLALLICCGAGLSIAAAAYFTVELSSKSDRYNSVSEIPYNRVALLLGTNPIGRNGKMNYYFKYRIDACVELYEAKKISKVLISGDNHIKEYDEPQAMKDALVARGIPASDIVLDYAGFRTLDSVVRSKMVFGQERLTVISQGFHNARALYLASHYGIEAVGYDAKDIKRTKTYLFFGVGREALARTKMFLDIIFNKQPKFLGEPIEV